jgi:hypothetical protein
VDANSIQVGGDHYKTVKGTQHWDLMAQGRVPYLEGNASKYGYRWPKKNGLEDIGKFEHYVQKILELHEQENYINEGCLSRDAWRMFCIENNVDPVSSMATSLVLFWKHEGDLLTCLDLLPQLRRAAGG